MSDNAVVMVCVTIIQIVIILAVFTDFFDNMFKKKKE